MSTFLKGAFSKLCNEKHPQYKIVLVTIHLAWRAVRPFQIHQISSLQ